MADFQQPNFFPGLQYQSVNPTQMVSTLDSIFNSQINRKLQEKQMDKMQADLLTQKAQQSLQYGMYGTSAQDVANATPGQWQQAMQPAPTQPMPGQGQGMYAQPGQAMVEEPTVTGLRNYIGAQRAMMQLGIQKEQAGIYKDIQQGREAGFYPDMINGGGSPAMPSASGANLMPGVQQRSPGAAAQFPTGRPMGTSGVSQSGQVLGPQNPGNNLVDQEAMNVITGNKPPSMIKGRGVDPKLSAAITNRINQLAPGFDWEKAETAYAGKTQAAQTQAGQGMQMPIRLGQSLLPNLDRLEVLANQYGKDSWQTINKYGMKLASERGDRGANAINTQASIISDEIQSMFGSGSDAKLDLATNLLSTAKTKEQLLDSTQLVRNAVKNRVQALSGQTPSNEKLPGMNFNNPGDVKNAVKAGTLDINAAKKILTSQFGYSP